MEEKYLERLKETRTLIETMGEESDDIVATIFICLNNLIIDIENKN